jgi:membrane-bound lytic murein transglycosylase F
MRYEPSSAAGSRLRSVPGVLLGAFCGWALLASGCSDAPVEQMVGPVAQTLSVSPSRQDPEIAEIVDDAEPIVERYVGDMDALHARGRLRILTPANIGGVFYLPRDGWPVAQQHEVAEAFARSEGLEPVLVPIPRFGDMIPALLEGRGDMIAANLTVTEARRRKIAFSVPLTTVKQQVLVARRNDAIGQISDLDGKRVMADPSSTFWQRLEQLRKRYPGIELVSRPQDFSDEDELDAVAAGEVDAALRDSNVAEMYLAYRDDLKLAFELPGTDDIAWGLRHDSPRLRSALNRYMHLEFADRTQSDRHTGDLAEIRERRVLRVLLRNNAASYFLYRGELKGFEYELAKAFAKAKRLRLEVIVPDSHAELIEWLKEGRGDIAAGFLEANETLADQGIAYSRPYHYAPRHLVVHADSTIADVADLEGRKVTVRRSSPYWKDLLDLKRDGVSFQIDAAPEDVETEELIQQVAHGELEATVADGHLLDIELAREVGVKSAFTISEQRPHSVAVRADNPELLAALDEFIKVQYRGVTYNVLYRKYFTNHRTIRDLAAGRVDSGAADGLSPYDEITRRYAERYGFDWRLITAQMFQESRFDPQAESFAGARGLLQVMPRTAKFMGFERLDQPEQNIHAGIKYLDWVRNRFESSLPFDERLWFTLAAYNAGHGHVQDARRLARQKGWDGDRWFENTEKAMLLLSKKKYAGKARHGYVRGIEPVSYVRNIRQIYRAYVELLEERVSQPRELADYVPWLAVVH